MVKRYFPLSNSDFVALSEDLRQAQSLLGLSEADLAEIEANARLLAPEHEPEAGWGDLPLPGAGPRVSIAHP